ncbi:hypothetical protein [Sphingomonas abietis]|uniref:Phage tail protein n=1 Tax=Sphingomonas abietis TaxID=3012344 RepID=A0ABY7NL89_9SPHN|nr:hypothetical protein [Sphingomonas abietis]WBO21740.1 hypothetical protein PBT88_16435 [Sphingomonas abietis]
MPLLPASSNRRYTIDVYGAFNEVVAAEQKMLATLDPTEVRKIRLTAPYEGTA